MKILPQILLIAIVGVLFLGNVPQVSGKERLFDDLQVRSDFFSSISNDRSTEVSRSSLESPRFYEDVEFYLGQRRRRSNSGGRVWANFYYSGAVLHPGDQTGKIRPDDYGIQVGLDFIRSQIAYLTLFYNYNHSNTGVENLCSSKIDTHLVGMGYFLYLSAFHWGIMGGIGYDEYRTKTDLFNLPNGYGVQANFYTEAGIDLKFGGFAFKPFLGFQYDFVYHGQIGSGESVVQKDWNVHGASGLLGLRLNYSPMEAFDIQFRSTWISELAKNPPPFYTARFSAVPGTATPIIFHYQGYTGRDFAWLGLGVKFEFGYQKFIFLDYDVLFNKYLTSHLGNIGLCLGW